MSLDLTIAIPIKNEQVNLINCLDSIGVDFAQRIVLLDSGSTDGTLPIAHDRGLDVMQFNWDGRFPKKRNWFLKRHTPQTKWILFLDADEYVTPQFKEELKRVLPNTQHTGFWLSYSVYFQGKKLKGGYPLDKLALFRVGSGEYERIDEDAWSDLDMEVHEHPIINGSVGFIHSKIDHQDFRGVSHWVSKHNQYSSWEAARFIRYASDPDVRTQWTCRQKIKYSFMRTPFLGIAYFFGSFFLMGGWRDGFIGLSYAILKMSYFTQIYCKYKENRFLSSKKQLRHW
jgi:glycosyltransferase involved in cell wall biosynthesis